MTDRGIELRKAIDTAIHDILVDHGKSGPIDSQTAFETLVLEAVIVAKLANAPSADAVVERAAKVIRAGWEVLEAADAQAVVN